MTKITREIILKQNNSDMCIVCGVNNPLSLNARFYELEGEILMSVITGRDEHQSYPDRMHGGIITAILDEVIGRAVQIGNPDIWGVTGKIEVAFKKPVRLNRPIKCFGKIIKQNAFSFIGKGYIEDEDGTVLATAQATYVKTPVEKMTDGDFYWEQAEDANPPLSAVILHGELLE